MVDFWVEIGRFPIRTWANLPLFTVNFPDISIRRLLSYKIRNTIGKVDCIYAPVEFMRGPSAARIEFCGVKNCGKLFPHTNLTFPIRFLGSEKFQKRCSLQNFAREPVYQICQLAKAVLLSHWAELFIFGPLGFSLFPGVSTRAPS